MPDYSCRMTLKELVNLSDKFSQATQQAVLDKTEKKVTSYIRPIHRQRAHRLLSEFETLNAAAEQIEADKNAPLSKMIVINASLQSVTLAMNDLLVEAAGNVLNREEITSLMPQELRNVAALELLELHKDKAPAIFGFARNMLQ